MLVLTRKAAEEIIFPALGITIRVLRTASNTVKLGIEAPPHFQIVRGELSSCDDLISVVGSLAGRIETHELRNRLNALTLKLELIKRAEQKGLSLDHLPMVEEVTNALASLDSELGRFATPSISPTTGPDAPRLLVVDDDANERELLTAVLILQGFEVEGAADGVEAINLLNCSRKLPNAILLDLEMPRLGGESTLRCIRSDRRFQHLKVVGISGRAPQVDMLPDCQRGFDAWFSKPLKLQQLLEIVRQPSREAPSDAAVTLAP